MKDDAKKRKKDERLTEGEKDLAKENKERKDESEQLEKSFVIDNGKYQCKKCKAIIKKRGNAVQHMNVHEDEENDAFDFTKVENSYKCKKCNSVITNRRTLNEHRKIHMGGGKKFACSDCSKSYTKPSDLNRHIKNNHKK